MLQRFFTDNARLTGRSVSSIIVAFISAVFLIAQMHVAEAASTLDNSAKNPETVDSQLSMSDVFIGLITNQSSSVENDLAIIRDNWHPGMVIMTIETIQFSQNNTVRNGLLNVMEEMTGQTLGLNMNAWYQWLWARDEQRHPQYASFKSELYAYLDPRFAAYFNEERQTRIRLDEIRWGGVAQDGIPPLRNPEMISADDADYLDDDNIVFGVAIDGDVRAYPKRILAWHEMFVDEIGGTRYAGVYCTLCGALILYETRYENRDHDLGTSGFLYRSNKVMYDKATQSLWNTTWGEPVVGPLVGEDIQLKRSYLVTTTWGEWKRRHPDTTVLSLNTGHQRDYGEGVAYRDYFATDELMFAVPSSDERLKNKDEILALQFPDVTSERLAISASFLEKNTVFQHSLGRQEFVVLTDTSGANRVYETQGVTFSEYDGNSLLLDAEGQQWTLSEGQLRMSNGQQSLERLPAHRAFWFGWVASWQDTQLIM
ncbi:MAG: DUF3179 domain-containing (seleno)protein [Granulosicoccus sp.]